MSVEWSKYFALDGIKLIMLEIVATLGIKNIHSEVLEPDQQKPSIASSRRTWSSRCSWTWRTGRRWPSTANRPANALKRTRPLLVQLQKKNNNNIKRLAPKNLIAFRRHPPNLVVVPNERKWSHPPITKKHVTDVNGINATQEINSTQNGSNHESEKCYYSFEPLCFISIVIMQ